MISKISAQYRLRIRFNIAVRRGSCLSVSKADMKAALRVGVRFGVSVVACCRVNSLYIDSTECIKDMTDSKPRVG